MRESDPAVPSADSGRLIRRRSDDHFTGLNRVTERVIGAAMAVHRAIGPGLLEAPYRECLAVELTHLGMGFEREVAVPVFYRGQRLDCTYRLDFLVEGQVVVEAKAVKKLDPIFDAQMLTYLKLTRHPLGLLINFNVPLLRQGIRRLVLRRGKKEMAAKVPGSG